MPQMPMRLIFRILYPVVTGALQFVYTQIHRVLNTAMPSCLQYYTKLLNGHSDGEHWYRTHFKFSRVGQSCVQMPRSPGMTNYRGMFSSRTIIQRLYYCSAYIQPPVMPRHEACRNRSIYMQIWNATATYSFCSIFMRRDRKDSSTIELYQIMICQIYLAPHLPQRFRLLCTVFSMPLKSVVLPF